MRLPSLIWLVVFIVIGAVPLAGQVQAERLNIDAFLRQWDTDHDGTLSVDEIKKATIARFEELDRNHKGHLSRSQLAGALTFQQFRKADKNKGGALDQDEFLSVFEGLFQAADKDHDGTLDKKELETPQVGPFSNYSLCGKDLLCSQALDEVERRSVV
jgi:Ca2+-binding EF-hand superfamily protein